MSKAKFGVSETGRTDFDEDARNVVVLPVGQESRQPER